MQLLIFDSRQQIVGTRPTTCCYRRGAHNNNDGHSITRSAGAPPRRRRDSNRMSALLLLLLSLAVSSSSCSSRFFKPVAAAAAAAGGSQRPRLTRRTTTAAMNNSKRIKRNTAEDDSSQQPPPTNPSIGTFNALIVLVQFPEHSNRILPSQSYIQNLCDTEIVPYLRDQSYQQYNIEECDVLPWRMTNQSQAYFANNESNMKGEDRAADFAVPVLDQWDADEGTIIDWSKYDRNGDGLLDSVMLVHSGWSAEMAEGLECGAAPWCVVFWRRCVFVVGFCLLSRMLSVLCGRCN